jgi:hypothetical protein
MAMYTVQYNNLCCEMRNWLWAGDCPSRDEAVLPVCCTRCELMIMAWRNGEVDLWFCPYVMVELCTRMRAIREDGEILMRNWDLRELSVKVKLPCQGQQVRFPISCVITPICGLLFSFRQDVHLIVHMHLYHPYCSHLHFLCLSISSTTLPSSQLPIITSSLPITSHHDHKWTSGAAYNGCSRYHAKYTPWGSVSKGSKFSILFHFWFNPIPDSSNRPYHLNSLDHCKLDGFTTKNLA